MTVLDLILATGLQDVLFWPHALLLTVCMVVAKVVLSSAGHQHSCPEGWRSHRLDNIDDQCFSLSKLADQCPVSITLSF